MQTFKILTVCSFQQISQISGLTFQWVGTKITGITAAHVVAGTLGTGVFTTNMMNLVNNVVTVTSNAGTCPVTSGLDTFTNSSAANMTITIATTSAVDGSFKWIRVYDASAVSKTITWVNTENSTVSFPASSNGSTTLPKIVLAQFNNASSKWRCLLSI